MFISCAEHRKKKLFADTYHCPSGLWMLICFLCPRHDVPLWSRPKGITCTNKTLKEVTCTANVCSWDLQLVIRYKKANQPGVMWRNLVRAPAQISFLVFENLQASQWQMNLSPTNGEIIHIHSLLKSCLCFFFWIDHSIACYLLMFYSYYIFACVCAWSYH